MTPTVLLEALHSRGVSARVENGDLKLRPARSLDAETLGLVREHKAALLALLQPPSPHEYSCAATDEGFTPRSACDAGAMTAFAWREFKRGKINDRQRDALLRYASNATDEAIESEVR